MSDAPGIPEALIARVARFIGTDLWNGLPVKGDFEIGAIVVSVISSGLISSEDPPHRTYMKILDRVKAILEGKEHGEEQI